MKILFKLALFAIFDDLGRGGIYTLYLWLLVEREF